jgi:hypothetical protein
MGELSPLVLKSVTQKMEAWTLMNLMQPLLELPLKHFYEKEVYQGLLAG